MLTAHKNLASIEPFDPHNDEGVTEPRKCVVCFKTKKSEMLYYDLYRKQPKDMVLIRKWWSSERIISYEMDEIESVGPQTMGLSTTDLDTIEEKVRDFYSTASHSINQSLFVFLRNPFIPFPLRYALRILNNINVCCVWAIDTVRYRVGNLRFHNTVECFLHNLSIALIMAVTVMAIVALIFLAGPVIAVVGPFCQALDCGPESCFTQPRVDGQCDCCNCNCNCCDDCCRDVIMNCFNCWPRNTPSELEWINVTMNCHPDLDGRTIENKLLES
jgi:hypothetical protein